VKLDKRLKHQEIIRDSHRNRATEAQGEFSEHKMYFWPTIKAEKLRNSSQLSAEKCGTGGGISGTRSVRSSTANNVSLPVAG
jgi:hypothetical protein